jgi:predicted dehydrogenase
VSGAASSGFVFGVIGLDHNHIYAMTTRMISAGGRCKGWWTEGEPGTLPGFIQRFPDVPRFLDQRALIEDPEITLVLVAARFDERAQIAAAAMRNGKDVMVDKPGCTSFEQLALLRRTVAETGRIWSINFSERFQVPAVLRAMEMVAEGAIGRVIQTIGLGPHRLNAKSRPAWFLDSASYGGILTDIASHQIDQFLVFTGSRSAKIVSATAANLAFPELPRFQDFGQVLLQGDRGHGYIRVDWCTPDGLPTWGDGRLTILGTDGYIELRKYIDIAGRPGANHLFLVNKTRCEHIDCSSVPLTYFQAFADDIRDRTETAMDQDHVFAVTELALQAQAIASSPPN